jgi:photosystem II stability/assembly factor-like uncharacterized protein
LFASDDQGATWLPRHAGVPVPSYTDVLFLDGPSLMVGARGGGVYRSDDDGASWNQTIAGLSNTAINDLARGTSGEIYAATYYGLYSSADGGSSWSPLGAELAELRVHGVHVDPEGRILAWTEGDDAVVYRSLDDGATWDPVFLSSELPLGGLFEDSVMAPDGRMYVGGLSFLVEGLLLTSGDGGETWDRRDLPELESIEVLAVRADGLLYAATSDDRIHVSDDAGESFTSLGDGPWQTTITALLVADDGTILVGTGFDGAYRSQDSGTTWESFSDGLPGAGLLRPSIGVLAARDGHVLAGTGNDGLFRSPFGAATAAPGADRLPAVARLAQNRPNPFNPRTSIAFSVPVASHARLSIHDLRGRRVRTLLDTEVAAGPHTVTWDGRDDGGRGLPSAVYLCRLETGGRVEAIRMVLAR